MLNLNHYVIGHASLQAKEGMRTVSPESEIPRLKIPRLTFFCGPLCKTLKPFTTPGSGYAEL